MKPKVSESIIQIFAYGLILAGIKLVYSFFTFFYLLDFTVFLVAGYLLGFKIPLGQRYLGLFLALPAFALSLFFVMQNGLTSISMGIGTSHAISLAVIPIATGLGILVNKRGPKTKY